jgi:hypothetical protein
MSTDSSSTFRIGTWNLRQCPAPSTDKGKTVASWLDAQKADVWLLTEVHCDWDPRGGTFIASPPRSFDGDKPKRWAGIETALPLTEIPPGSEGHSGEEGLVLARVDLEGTSILVACSVLPWKGAGDYWHGLPSGQLEQWRHVLDHHVARISAERRADEPLVWGGDFNQPLLPPFEGTTKAGAEALRTAFDDFGLAALTEEAGHLISGLHSIDHLAVSRNLAGEVAEMHRPVWPNGDHLSDHAAYTADVVLPRT